MLKKISFYLSCILIMLLQACGSESRNMLVGGWTFIEMKNGNQTFTLDKSNYATFHTNLILNSEGNFLLLDGGIEDYWEMESYTHQELERNGRTDRIYYGTWQENSENQTTTFTLLSHPQAKALQFSDGKADKTRLYLTLDNPSKSAYSFKRDDYNDIARSTNNFLSTKLNRWRIPADKKESPEQIKARTKNGIEFAISYIRYYMENKDGAAISFLKPLPLKIASNGLAFETNNEWESLFYDLEDWQMSYDLLKKAIQNSAKIPDALRGNSMGINLFIFEEILKGLEQ